MANIHRTALLEVSEKEHLPDSGRQIPTGHRVENGRTAKGFYRLDCYANFYQYELTSERDTTAKP